MNPTTFLLAQRREAPIEELARAFREAAGSGSDILESVALLALVFAVIIACLYLAGVLQQRRAAPVGRQPGRLFRATLRELDLAWSDRIVLMFVARSAGLRHPTVMLLSPVLLERYVRAWSKRVSIPGVRVAAWRRMSNVSVRLFGEALPALR